jgi:hypothetical protein
MTMSDGDDYLATVENYRAYLAGLPEPTDDDMYCVEIVGRDSTTRYALMFEMDDASALEVFDISFMEIYRDNSDDEFPEYMVLLSPENEYGERREVARIDLEEQ